MKEVEEDVEERVEAEVDLEGAAHLAAAEREAVAAPAGETGWGTLAGRKAME